MEWAENSAFEDRASLTIVNRNLPVPRFSSSLKDGILSRDGWALVDESGRHLFTDDGWVAARGGRRNIWNLIKLMHFTFTDSALVQNPGQVQHS